MILQARNLDRAQWGILSLLPTTLDGAGVGEMTSPRVFLVPWAGARSPVYFGVVNLHGWTEEGIEGAESHLSGCAGHFPGFKALLCSLLSGPFLGNKATEGVFKNGETEPQVQRPGLAQSKCPLEQDFEL